jgi:hypothetical protein
MGGGVNQTCTKGRGNSIVSLMCDPGATVNTGTRYWSPGEYGERYRGLVAFMGSVLKSNQPPYIIGSRWGVKTAMRKPGAPRKDDPASYFKQCRDFMDLYVPWEAFSPDFKLFFDCYREFDPLLEPFFTDPNLPMPDGSILAERFNAFVAYIRDEARARRVKKKLADWKANKRQRRSIRRLFESVCVSCEGVLSARFDLGWTETAAVESDAVARMSWERGETGEWGRVALTGPSGDGRLETRARIDVSEAMRQRELFFENQRGADRELFAHLKAYVCRLEQGGERRSNHMHVIFLYDAKRVKDADRLINLARQRWARVTGGLGLVFNCHGRPDKARLKAEGKWAIDPVDCSDSEQVAKLTEYVHWYFNEDGDHDGDDDQLVRNKPTPKARTLTMGRI